MPLPPVRSPWPWMAAGALAFAVSACSPQSLTSRSGAGASPTPTEPALAGPLPGVYVALGASETYGVGATPHTNGYAYLLARSLRTRRFLNVGIPGATLGSGYQTELTAALSVRPSLCTVFFGVNDIRAHVKLGAFLSDLADLTAALRRAGSQVLIVGIPDLSQVPAVRQSRLGGLAATTRSWNGGMRRVARQTRSQFFDLSGYAAEIAAHPAYISPDGLHPSNRGYARLSQVLGQAIRTRHLWRIP